MPMATQTNKASERATAMLGAEEPVEAGKNNLISTPKATEAATAPKLEKGQVNYGSGYRGSSTSGYGSGDGYSNGFGTGT